MRKNDDLVKYSGYAGPHALLEKDLGKGWRFGV